MNNLGKQSNGLDTGMKFSICKIKNVAQYAKNKTKN